jgi:hypothetical protein
MTTFSTARIARELGLHVLNPKVIEQPGGAIEMGQVENVQLKLGSLPVRISPWSRRRSTRSSHLSVNSWTAFSDTAFLAVRGRVRLCGAAGATVRARDICRPPIARSSDSHHCSAARAPGRNSRWRAPRANRQNIC